MNPCASRMRHAYETCCLRQWRFFWKQKRLLSNALLVPMMLKSLRCWRRARSLGQSFPMFKLLGRKPRPEPGLPSRSLGQFIFNSDGFLENTLKLDLIIIWCVSHMGQCFAAVSQNSFKNTNKNCFHGLILNSDVCSQNILVCLCAASIYCKFVSMG